MRGGDAFIDEIGNEGREDHQDTHCEDPDDQGCRHSRVCGQRQGEKGDQGHAGYAVGLETVRRGADAVARVVAGTVGDNAGVLRIIFGKMEDDLHKVGADVGDLREDTARDPERARAQRLADGEADEAGAGQFLEEDKDADHEEELNADKQKADAHAGVHGDIDDINGFAASEMRRPFWRSPWC